MFFLIEMPVKMCPILLYLPVCTHKKPDYFCVHMPGFIVPYSVFLRLQKTKDIDKSDKAKNQLPKPVPDPKADICLFFGFCINIIDQTACLNDILHKFRKCLTLELCSSGTVINNA